jgi:hypothetical protein
LAIMRGVSVHVRAGLAMGARVTISQIQKVNLQRDAAIMCKLPYKTGATISHHHTDRQTRIHVMGWWLGGWGWFGFLRERLLSGGWGRSRRAVDRSGGRAEQARGRTDVRVLLESDVLRRRACGRPQPAGERGWVSLEDRGGSEFTPVHFFTVSHPRHQSDTRANERSGAGLILRPTNPPFPPVAAGSLARIGCRRWRACRTLDSIYGRPLSQREIPRPQSLLARKLCDCGRALKPFPSHLLLG